MDAITKDSKEWVQALTFAGKWQWNCSEHQIGDGCSRIPDITPAHLYAILEALGEYGVELYMMNDDEWAIEIGSRCFTGDTLDDVIIRAASLQVNE